MGRSTLAERGYRWVRNTGLATPLVGQAIRRVRARMVETSYIRMARHYASIPTPPASAQQLLMQRAGDRISCLRSLHRPLRILFVGTDRLQDTSGILRALAEIGQVQPLTQRDGAYGQLTPDGDLSFAMAGPLSQRTVELAAEAERTGRPFDVLIGQMWAGYIDPSGLSHLRRRFGIVVVNIAMDDRHAFNIHKLGRTIGSRALIPHIDLAATAAPEAVEWYLKEGCPAIFFPEASDPDLFRPMPDLPKQHDVSFVGARYGIRERIVRRIEAVGVALEARGAGWPAGRIPTEEVPRLFAASKIVLGIGTVGHSERLYALKLRDFDGPMSGSCYLTHSNRDLARLYKIGEEIAVYRDDDDCVRVVRDLLADDSHRDAIARKGRTRAMRDHTWTRRFRQLLEFLRGSDAIVSSR